MKTIVLLATYVLFLTTASAQNGGNISGTITQNNKSAEGVTVSLLRAKDSSTIKFSVTNKAGQFAFDAIAHGKYLVAVTAVGQQKAFSKVVEVSPQQPAVQVPPIILVPAAKDLSGVTVTAKRPLVEQRIDRTIVNVDASITNVGTTALEVLEKSPGISVDIDGNVSLKGKQSVMIMVDGRPTQLGGADLANLLRNMNSSQLDQIEIMTNPPAKYDASGNAGVINIKTKKAIKAGLNGSASLSYGHGKYSKVNEGFNFNYREGKVNLFTNLSHNYQKNYSIMSLDRKIFNSTSGAVSNIFNQEATRVSEGNGYNGKFGVDFFANPKTTIGAVVNLSQRGMVQNNPNVTNISNSSKVLQSITRAIVDNEMSWNSISTNLNFRRLLDKKGKEITSDFDYVKHSMNNDAFMVNSYTDANGAPLRKADTLMGTLPQNINIYSGRLDYLHPLSKNARLEAGIKSSIVRTDNDANYDSIQYGNVIHDISRSNHFVYEENINAAYVNLSTSLTKKISAQFGLRIENTNAKGIQKTTGEDFDRSYTQLFPTAYFQYKANDKNNFAINFGRRVNRPSYQSLNPFIRFIDRYTFSQGNPELKPSISYNIELSHSWKNQITTTVNYTYVKDIIQSIIQQKGEEAYNMPANVASLSQFGIAVNANTPITKWWTSSMAINVFNDNMRGNVNDASIDRSATFFTLNGTQQFKLTKTFSAEISGMYRSKGLNGVMRTNPVGQVTAGLSKQVLKNKGTIRLSVRDIFWTQRLRGVTQYGNVDVEMRQVSETRVASIGFTYSFSKGKKIAPVKRTQGSAGDEQNRVGN
jgi:hypothetical protein